MATQWVSRKQAADSLGCSVRTMQRWINAGTVPSRLRHGRREVMLQSPEDEQAAQHDAEHIAELERQLTIAEARRQAAEHVAAVAQNELRRVWRLGTLACAWAAVLVVGVLVGVGFSSARVARATTTNDRLSGDLQAVEQQLSIAQVQLEHANTLAQETVQLRAELSQTHEMLQTAQRGRAEAIAELAQLDLHASSDDEPVLAARAEP